VGSQESEEMLVLLKELSMLKALDTEYQSGRKSEEEQQAHRVRQQRHEEIGQEIKALAEQKKANQQNMLP
jgi:hypothetical protein